MENKTPFLKVEHLKQYFKLGKENFLLLMMSILKSTRVKFLALLANQDVAKPQLAEALFVFMKPPAVVFILMVKELLQA